ncbi:MAG TPA: hypothetical protein VI913_05225 [Candidatus Peribacteraceae bacterium]|nr:hypothetical protein [Candidatus Peribacteraceae bacterium]
MGNETAKGAPIDNPVERQPERPDVQPENQENTEERREVANQRREGTEGISAEQDQRKLAQTEEEMQKEGKPESKENSESEKPPKSWGDMFKESLKGAKDSIVTKATEIKGAVTVAGISAFLKSNADSLISGIKQLGKYLEPILQWFQSIAKAVGNARNAWEVQKLKWTLSGIDFVASPEMKELAAVLRANNITNILPAKESDTGRLNQILYDMHLAVPGWTRQEFYAKVGQEVKGKVRTENGENGVSLQDLVDAGQKVIDQANQTKTPTPTQPQNPAPTPSTTGAPSGPTT